jgi:hypothetical protein
MEPWTNLSLVYGESAMAWAVALFDGVCAAGSDTACRCEGMGRLLSCGGSSPAAVLGGSCPFEAQRRGMVAVDHWKSSRRLMKRHGHRLMAGEVAMLISRCYEIIFIGSGGARREIGELDQPATTMIE